MQAVTLAAGI